MQVMSALGQGSPEAVQLSMTMCRCLSAHSNLVMLDYMARRVSRLADRLAGVLMMMMLDAADFAPLLLHLCKPC